MQVITSKDNEIIKNIKKLKEKKYRDQTGEYIIEGIKLVSEAISESTKISKIVVCEDCETYNEDIILVLDAIADPGNLGTILRTADSVNLKQIILSQNCADPYNPKVVRSTMGAIFRLNIIESKNIIETLKEIKKNKYKIVATSLETNESIYTIDLNRKAIIIGNEANGVSKEVLEIANEKIKIPMLGKTESLNAAVATGVILYEYVRRKMK